MVIKKNGILKNASNTISMKEINFKILNRYYSEEKIGENAGKIWHILNKKGIQSVKLITAELKISGLEVHLAIGWLSREGKIYFEERNNEIYLLLK